MCVCVELVTVCLFLLRVLSLSHSIPPPHPSFFSSHTAVASCCVPGRWLVHTHTHRRTHISTHIHMKTKTHSKPSAGCGELCRSLSLLHTTGRTEEEDDKRGRGESGGREAGLWGGGQNRMSGHLSSVKSPSTCVSTTWWADVFLSGR